MIKKYRDIIFQECMKTGGFASLIRENEINELGFAKLINAIQELTKLTCNEKYLDKLTVASLYELPWEIENTIEHYTNQNKELGIKVSKMADELREAINEFLWSGLEDSYEEL